MVDLRSEGVVRMIKSECRVIVTFLKHHLSCSYPILYVSVSCHDSRIILSLNSPVTEEASLRYSASFGILCRRPPTPVDVEEEPICNSLIVRY